MTELEMISELQTRVMRAESRLRRAVDLMEDLLGLERGSSEKALAFINEYDAEEAHQ